MPPHRSGLVSSLCLPLVVGVLVAVYVAVYSQKYFAQNCDAGTYEGAFAGEEVVPQNWNCRERQEFWFTDQGSQIIPYVWFLHLEQAGSEAKFADPANIDRYRYLPQKPTEGMICTVSVRRGPGNEILRGALHGNRARKI